MANYDIVKDYDWTSMPRDSGMRAKAPRVVVKSFKVNTNQIHQALQGYSTIAKTAGADGDKFYEELYSGATTRGDNFNFPFFGDDVRSFSNSFGDSFQGAAGGDGIGNKANNFVKGVVGIGAEVRGFFGSGNVSTAIDQALNGQFKAAKDTMIGGAKAGGDPGTYIETPQYYQFDKDSDAPLSITFVLANTINADSVTKNNELVKKLTMMNRPMRKNSTTVDPPSIYQVRVPGQRFIRWAYCDSFSVRLLGTRREINQVVVPEAYEITMSFKSLTLEHAGFMDKA